MTIREQKNWDCQSRYNGSAVEWETHTSQDRRPTSRALETMLTERWWWRKIYGVRMRYMGNSRAIQASESGQSGDVEREQSRRVKKECQRGLSGLQKGDVLECACSI